MRAQGVYKAGVLWKPPPLDPKPTCRVPRLWLQTQPHSTGQTPRGGCGALPTQSPTPPLQGRCARRWAARCIVFILWMRKLSLREGQWFAHLLGWWKIHSNTEAKLAREPRNMVGAPLGLWVRNNGGLGQNHDSTAPETSLPLRGGSAPTPTLLEAPNSQNPAISTAVPAPGTWISTPLPNPRSSVSLLPSFLTCGNHVPARSLCLPLEVPQASPVPLPPLTCKCDEKDQKTTPPTPGPPAPSPALSSPQPLGWPRPCYLDSWQGALPSAGSGRPG